MTDRGVKLTKDNNLATVTLVAPEGVDKLDHFVTEVADARSRIASDHGIRVVVLTGFENAPSAMSEGVLGEMVGNEVVAVSRLWAIAEQIASINLPVVGAINGDAIGLALELAMACDIRIATDAAHFGFLHIKEGLIPWDGGTQRLSRVVGQAKAMEMILTGEVVDAEEAYRIGLVTKVVTHQELMPVTMDMAREMASKGPVALRYAKEAIHKGMDLTLEQGLRLEADLYFLLHTTKDRTEGITAFQEKRTPDFEGR